MKGKVMLINGASVAAFLSLVVGLAVGVMAMLGRTDLDTYKLVFDGASLVWFVTSPLWFVPKLFGKDFEEAGKQAWLRPRS